MCEHVPCVCKQRLTRLLRTLTLAGGQSWYHSPEGLFRQLWRPQKSCLLLPGPSGGCGAYVGLGGRVAGGGWRGEAGHSCSCWQH